MICVPFSHVQFSTALLSQREVGWPAVGTKHTPNTLYTPQTFPTHTKHSLHTLNTPYSESSISPHAICLSLGLQQAAKFLDLTTAIHSKIQTRKGFKIVLFYSAMKHHMQFCNFLQLQCITKSKHVKDSK